MTGEASNVGKVLRQSPSGGTHVNKGTTVRLFVGVSGGGSTTTTTTTDHDHADHAEPGLAPTP